MKLKVLYDIPSTFCTFAYKDSIIEYRGGMVHYKGVSIMLPDVWNYARKLYFLEHLKFMLNAFLFDVFLIKYRFRLVQEGKDFFSCGTYNACSSCDRRRPCVLHTKG